MAKKALPMGIDDFRELITQDYYYVDKSLLIKELLDKRGKANLFTRPRRFGKTLNLSMLQYFFEDTSYAREEWSNKELFTGLAIMQAGGIFNQPGLFVQLSLSGYRPQEHYPDR